MSLILLLPRPYRYHKDKLKLLFQNIKPFREVNMQLGRRFYSFKYVPSRKWPSHRMNAFWCISSFMFPQVTPVLMPVLLPLPWKYIKQDPDINNFISAKVWRTSKSGSKITKNVFALSKQAWVDSFCPIMILWFSFNSSSHYPLALATLLLRRVDSRKQAAIKPFSVASNTTH